MTRIAVTGARGRLGGQVCSLLAEADGVEVLPVTRAVADYNNLAALQAVLNSVDTLVLVTSDGPADRVLQHHLNLLVAATLNVSHIELLLSSSSATWTRRSATRASTASPKRC